MKKMISKGMYVLCYDNKMKLVQEFGPYYSDSAAFCRMHKEEKSGKYKHVEVAEKVIMK